MTKLAFYLLCFCLCISTAVTSCSRTMNVVVNKSEIHRHIVELRDTGSATVDANNGKPYTLKTSDTLPMPGATSLSVEKLIANCPDIAPFARDSFQRDPPCLLQQSGSTFFLSEEEIPDPYQTKVAIWMATTTSAAIASGICTFGCDVGPVQVASVLGLVVFGAGAAIGLIFAAH